MRTWRYAYNTNGLAHHRLADAIDLVADLGYDALSLTPDVQHLDPLRATAKEVDAVAAHLRKRGLAVSIQTGARFVLDPRRKHGPTLLDAEPQARQRRIDFLVRCLDLGRDLGANVLSFWSGTPSASDPAVELSRRLVDGCRAVADAAAERGMLAAFEPEPGMWVSTVDHWSLLRTNLGHPAFRLALDVGHVHCNAEGDVVRMIRAHAPLLADVQVEDMRVGEHVHLPFGEGTLDIAPALRALLGVGYQGQVVVELSRDSHRAVDVARAALDHLRRIVP